MSDTKIDFLYLNEQDMIKAGVTDMAGCVDAMEEMFRLMKIGDFRMGGENCNSHGTMMLFPKESPFPNMPLDGTDRRFMAMPAYLGGKFDMAGCKWYGSNAANRDKGLPRSILMLTLNDKDTGAPLAHMSANILSAYRTGAVPGVGIKYLAKKDAKTFGVFGPGVMGKTMLAAAMAVRPGIDTIKIAGRSQGSIDSYVAYVKENFPSITNISIVSTLEETIRDTDVVSIALTSIMGNPDLYPFIDEEWIKPGAIVCCPAAAKFDDDFLINRARTVVDCIGLYEAWAEEYPYPTYSIVYIPACKIMDLIHEGKMTKDQIDDLGDILVGNKPVIRNEDDKIIYSVGGMPTEDIAWGTIVYRNALEKGIGTKLNLWDAPALT
jgi:ornithine cyclodeaminase